MTALDPRDRLQPALLDRLVDDARARLPPNTLRPPATRYTGWRPKHGPTRVEPPPAQVLDPDRTMSKARLRQAVLRDLGALFNAVQSVTPATVAAFPPVAETVLNFGLPPLAGRLASQLDPSQLERTLRQTLLRYEPRILAESLRVRAVESESVLDTHNVIEFEISGHLWSQPIPLEILLRTQVDLEAGQVRVRDAGASSDATSR